jgi:hypothetical protein
LNESEAAGAIPPFCRVHETRQRGEQTMDDDDELDEKIAAIDALGELRKDTKFLKGDLDKFRQHFDEDDYVAIVATTEELDRILKSVASKL